MLQKGHPLSRPGLAIVLLAAPMSASCSKHADREPVFPVKGQVTVGGQPAEGAVLVFFPVEKKGGQLIRPSGTTDEQGRFSLTTYTERDGAPARREHSRSAAALGAARPTRRPERGG